MSSEEPESSESVVICLSDDDEGDDAAGLGGTGSTATSQKENVENGSTDGGAGGAKPPPPNNSSNAEGGESDVEVVDAAAPQWNTVATTAAPAPAAAASTTATGGGDEELEIVGTANVQTFVHSRQDCLEFRYDVHCTGKNAQFCKLCYCYVCDKPASECMSWFKGATGAVCSRAGENGAVDAQTTGEDDGGAEDPRRNHCHAIDRGDRGESWKNLRTAAAATRRNAATIRRMSAPAAPAPAPAAAAATAAAAGGEGEDSDEELEVVGTANEQNFVHNRQDCLAFRYDRNGGTEGEETEATRENKNAKFCKLCYCFVCDKPASECGDWFRGDKGVCASADAAEGGDSGEGNPKTTGEDDDEADGKPKAGGEDAAKPHRNHCDATDKGDQKELWKNMRKAVREGRDPSQVTNVRERDNADDSMAQYMRNYADPATAAAYFAMHGGGGGSSALGGGGGGSTHGGASSSLGMYASTTYEAARTSSRGRGRGRSHSAPAPRKRNRTSGTKRPAPHDHRQRIRTQAMLEDLYG